MKSVMVILSLILLSQTSVPQEITPQTVIDGSKVVLEFIKTFRKPSQERIKNKVPVNPLAAGDICFINQSPYTSRIEICKKINDTIYQPMGTILVVNPGSEECLLDVSTGVYRYNLRNIIRSDSMNPGRQGEFRLEANERILHFIE